MYSIDEYATLFNIKSSPFINVFKNINGSTDSIKLSPEGVSKARLLDKDAYTGLVNGQPSGYSNQMRDSYIGIKIGFPNLVLGIRAWKTSESFGFYQDLYSAGTKMEINGLFQTLRFTPCLIKHIIVFLFLI